MNPYPYLTGLASVAFAMSAWSQNIIDILPGSHNVTITSATYDIDGNTIVQTSEASGVEHQRNAPVHLKSVTVQNGSSTRTLNTFNSLGAAVTNVGLTSSTTGVGVFDNGTEIRTNISGITAFSTALAGTTQDTDLMNYSFYDFVGNMPDPNVSDYDLLFQYGLEPSDFVLVSERWGNTYFSITPLDALGTPIAGANTMRFGYPTGGAYQMYDWNSGYASSTYVNSQAMAFSVASVSKFFESSTASHQTVFGFRIDNDGEADVKFFGLSDQTFTDNPFNPNPAIPEPSSALLAMLSIAPLIARRRR